MFSSIYIASILALSGFGNCRTFGSRTQVNNDASQAIDTSSDSTSSTLDRIVRVQDLSESVEGPDAGSTTQIGTDSRSTVNSFTGGQAENVITDRDGNILSISYTDTYGDNDATSTITRVTDIEDDRSTVVGTSGSTSYSGTGTASSEGGVYAFGDCDFTNVQITSMTATQLSSAFTTAYTTFDCTVDDCDNLPLSMVYVVDESGSISSSEFSEMIAFLGEMTVKVDSSSEFAYVEFHNGAFERWGWVGVSGALNNLANENQSGGGTDLKAGVEKGLMVLGNATSGNKKVMVVLTDGSPNSGQEVCSGGSPLVSIPSDVSVFVVNIGSGSSQSNTACIADGQVDSSDFSQLGGSVDPLLGLVC